MREDIQRLLAIFLFLLPFKKKGSFSFTGLAEGLTVPNILKTSALRDQLQS
jgi:hypothetical protein